MNSVLGRVEVAGRLGQVGRVDVGDEPEGQRPVGVVAQRQVGHRRAEVGAADADVDHGPDPLAGVPGPLAGLRTRSAKSPIRSSTSCTSATTSCPSTSQPLASRGIAQRDVQDGAVLGDVDVLAARTSPRSARAARRARPARPAAGSSRRSAGSWSSRGRGRRPRTGELLAARGILGEQLAQVPAAQLLPVGGQRRPLRGLVDPVRPLGTLSSSPRRSSRRGRRTACAGGLHLVGVVGDAAGGEPL